jgi:hypothetical protein
VLNVSITLTGPIDNSSFNEQAVNAASAPAGYFFAPDQACVQTVVDLDSYCVATDWDNICQNAHNDCTYGVDGCSWYLQYTVSTGPAVWACAAPDNYCLANQPCAQSVINNDPYYVNSFWDNLYQNAYCARNSGCLDPSACNYDPEACSDDGSCTFPNVSNNCTEDLNQDGVVNAADLLQFLGGF